MALLGQHFLHDAFYLDQILQSIPYEHFDNEVQMVEIGVGLGDLTARLLDRLGFKTLIAYEVDRALAQGLKHRLSPSSWARLVLVVGDVMEQKGVGNGADVLAGLKLPRAGFLCDRPYFLVSNLPYYIATPIIARALKDSLCVGLVVMTQLEVGLKFCAQVGSKDYGALSVLAGLTCVRRELCFEVPKEAFNPPPKVRSSVIALIKHHLESTLPSLDVTDLESLLKRAFKANRKTLSNNLKGLCAPSWLENFLTQHSLTPQARPHQLSPTDYLDLACDLIQQSKIGAYHG
ncbi:16S rRNA (adenine(1518)-N(6)/adenine(1519)-N(6))-dimethyltransferase RsmA [Helicobacter cynogastricus]|uniref:16S rRNA (adenine(1518)-N(6)/adenine(1519)-N(6))- dimethyltransferase RsmA n=1 Tax=Helicobacter cynogastricus TaxID=329937 RepID=UPI000CF1902E|nr:16S rRNA (adenine(1518)-N(6)/adenine(1519)-N(6))-dimethyltransferase RsmA [Helicobacter cynogastricus]